MDGETELHVGTVTLETIDIETGNDFDGTTKSDRGGSGNWTAEFVHAGAETVDAPGGVVGTFNSGLPNGAVAGAFGATKQ